MKCVLNKLDRVFTRGPCLMCCKLANATELLRLVRMHCMFTSATLDESHGPIRIPRASEAPPRDILAVSERDVPETLPGFSQNASSVAR